MAVELLARGEWTSYAVGTRPAFEAGVKKAALPGSLA
jgi:phosphate starvation-inducible protein PhoH